MRSPDGKLRTVSGIYNLIDRPRRLVFTWGWDDDEGLRGHETEVTVTLEAHARRHRLKLVQQLVQTSEVRNLPQRRLGVFVQQIAEDSGISFGSIL